MDTTDSACMFGTRSVRATGFKRLRPSEAPTESCPAAAQIDNEDLVFTLETIVEKFGEDMAPYAVGLCQHLTQAFWRMQVRLPSPEQQPRPTQGLVQKGG